MNKRFLSALAIGAAVLSLGACNKSSSSGGSTTEGNWIKKANFGGNARAYAVSFTVGDSVAYVGSGQGTADPNTTYTRLSDFWKFRPTDNGGLGGWTQVANMPRGRYNAVAFSIGAVGYVGTGYDDSITSTVNATLGDFYAFNTQSNTWTQKASLPEGAARQQAVGFAINNLGYIGTGRDKNRNALGDFYQYNPSSDTWTAITAGYPGDKRYGAVAFVHNNLAYITTGTGGATGAYTNTYDFFSFDGTAWTTLSNISNTSSDTYDDSYTTIVRTGAVAFVIGDWAYLTTGANQNTWAYKFSTDRWEVRTPYVQTTRSGAVGFAIGSYGYVGTGSASGTPTYNFSQFDPSATYDENSDK
ncbi:MULTISPECIES: Kelch repeat-containing protein [Chitinophagaceae]